MLTVFDRLLSPAMPILRQIEDERPKHGNETLTWLEFVRALVYFFTRRCESRNAWAVALANADPALQLLAVPRMTLSGAMYRFPPGMLRRAVRALLASRNLVSHPELAFISDAYAVDGSEFPVINGIDIIKVRGILIGVFFHGV